MSPVTPPSSNKSFKIMVDNLLFFLLSLHLSLDYYLFPNTSFMYLSSKMPLILLLWNFCFSIISILWKYWRFFFSIHHRWMHNISFYGGIIYLYCNCWTLFFLPIINNSMKTIFGINLGLAALSLYCFVCV